MTFVELTASSRLALSLADLTVDVVLYDIVIINIKITVANECLDSDLFWAVGGRGAISG
jgi:hypothetical protein